MSTRTSLFKTPPTYQMVAGTQPGSGVQAKAEMSEPFFLFRFGLISILALALFFLSLFEIENWPEGKIFLAASLHWLPKIGFGGQPYYIHSDQS